jgi:general secretion pathway protein L
MSGRAMSTLGPAIPIGRLARAGSRFWRWWIAELAACIPAGLRRQFGPKSRRLLVACENGAGELIRISGGRPMPLGRLDLSPSAPAAIPEALSRALRRGTVARVLGRGPYRIDIRLTASQALRTVITLPDAVIHDLDRVLAFELDRRTPFAAPEVHFGYRIEAREPAGMIRVALVVVPRRVVATATDALRRLGAKAKEVEVAGVNDEAPIALRMGESGARPPRKQRRLLRIGTVLMVLLAVAAALPQLKQREATIDTLRRDATALQAQAKEAEKVRDRIARLQTERQYLAARRGRDVSLNGVLNQLSKLLPDDTWLVRVHISSDRIVLAGYSGASSNLIRLLAESKLVEAPRFASPVVRDDQLKRESFTITATLPTGGRK